jgi:leucyl aminopeptidase
MMQFSIKPLLAAKSTKATVECLLIPVQATAGHNGLNAFGQTIDAYFGGELSAAIASGDLGSTIGQTIMLRPAAAKMTETKTTKSSASASSLSGLSGLSGLSVRRIVLVNFGTSKTKEIKALSAKQFVDASTAAVKACMPLGCTTVMNALCEAIVEGKDLQWQARTQVTAARELHYKFSELKTAEAAQKPASKLTSIVLVASDKIIAQELQKGLDHGMALANGVDTAKRLGNLPGNFCTPAYLANQAKQLGKSHGFKVEVLERKQIQALKMGSFLSVTQGSDEPPKLIVMQYFGASAKQAPVALVGKGITFDTGGISLKPGGEMDEMKFDMCGAASVIGAFQAVAELKLKINLVGVIPACENMPSSNATKPGDVFTSMSGQTIEVLNTDAEGRLVLCDALTFVKKFKPTTVIDIATLTGACIIALGHYHSGLFSKEDALAHELLDAGRSAGDTCWRMPMDEAYGELLKSNFADLANIGGRAAGSVTAACFLEKFVDGYEWAHVDIAGTAWKSGAAKGSTGRPVPLLVEFLSKRAAK